MKQNFIATLLLSAASLATAQIPQAGQITEPVQKVTSPGTNLFISERGPHHRVISKVQWHTNRFGRAISTTNTAYTELATGLHRKDALGRWTAADSSFTITPDGYATADGCQHRVVLSPNINDPQGAVDFQTPKGGQTGTKLILALDGYGVRPFYRKHAPTNTD